MKTRVNGHWNLLHQYHRKYFPNTIVLLQRAVGAIARGHFEANFSVHFLPKCWVVSNNSFLSLFLFLGINKWRNDRCLQWATRDRFLNTRKELPPLVEIRDTRYLIVFKSSRWTKYWERASSRIIRSVLLPDIIVYLKLSDRIRKRAGRNTNTGFFPWMGSVVKLSALFILSSLSSPI